MSRHGPITAASGQMTKAEQTLLALILIHLRDGIVVTDRAGRIEWINPSAERMFGWPLNQVIGRSAATLASPESGSGQALLLDRGKSRLQGLHVAEHRRRDGSTFWNQHNFTLVETGPARWDRKVVITCRDVSKQIKAEAEARQMRARLEHAATHDDLTGLANRKKLTHYLESSMTRRRIAKGEIGILQLDIDLFKEINDTLGHAAGDALLRHVAKAMHACAGPADLCCRTGGDEFVLICTGIRDAEALMAQGETLRATIAEPMPWAAQTLQVGASIGASLPPGPDIRGETLIQMADQALYAAKHRGRGRVVLYDPRMGRVQTAETQLAQELRTALRDRQFLVHLQPQLDLRQNRITRCEALLRWTHPERGLLLPGDFLKTAETYGLLAEIDYHATTLSLEALMAVRAAGFGDLNLALNLSGSILADVNYPALLNWALQSRGIAAQDICVEIRETTMLDRRGPDVRATIRTLKEMGLCVALDDFGTGYAGLAHMASFDIDAIKLDCSLTARLDRDPRSRAVALAVLQLSRNLGMDMVAEGVETEAQFDILRTGGCPLMQGFWLAYPMASDDLIAWLRAELDPRMQPRQSLGARLAPSPR